MRHLDEVDDRTLDPAIVGVGDRAPEDERQPEASRPVTSRQTPVIDKDADHHHSRDQQEDHPEVLEEAKGRAGVARHGQKEDVVDDLARPVGNPEPLLDENLRDAVDDDDGGGDHPQQEVAANPAQFAATRMRLTRRSFPSICKVSVEAPLGAAPRATATTSVSVAI